jgi:chromosome segregation ATPase
VQIQISQKPAESKPVDLSQSTEKYDNEVKTFQLEKSRLIDEKQLLESQLKDFQSKLEDANKNIEIMQSTLSALQLEKSQLQQESNLRENSEKQSNQQMEEKIRNLEEIIKQKQQKIEEISLENSNLLEKCNQTALQVETLTKSIEQLQVEQQQQMMNSEKTSQVIAQLEVTLLLNYLLMTRN